MDVDAFFLRSDYLVEGRGRAIGRIKGRNENWLIWQISGASRVSDRVSVSVSVRRDRRVMFTNISSFLLFFPTRGKSQLII